MLLLVLVEGLDGLMRLHDGSELGWDDLKRVMSRESQGSVRGGRLEMEMEEGHPWSCMGGFNLVWYVIRRSSSHKYSSSSS